MALLDVTDLRIALPTPQGPVEAVRGVSFQLERGEVLGVIGESGCGKSLTALALMGLLPEGATAHGSVRLGGHELLGQSEADWCALRGNRIAMVFQEPMTALNPLHPIGRQVAEPLRRHRGLSAAAARTEALALLDRVGIARAAERYGAYPHQFSGGQRQRIGIAMALACGPDVLVADEPTTALDVTVQRQILDLLGSLVAERGMALVLISHDLGVVAQTTDRTLVMYGGSDVEAGRTEDVFRTLAHPYTRGLFAARPQWGTAPSAGPRPHLPTIVGTVPALADVPPGCPFAGRCAFTVAACHGTRPLPTPVGADHHARCLRLDAVAAAAPASRASPFALDSIAVSAYPESATGTFEPEFLSRDQSPLLASPHPDTRSAPAESAPVSIAISADPSSVKGTFHSENPLLAVRGLAHHYPLPRTRLWGPRLQLQALAGVDFVLHAGRSLGVVGESGSGKSTLARLVMALDTPGAGSVAFLGRDLHALPPAELQRARRDFQMVFQDPVGSLDPRMTVERIVAEPLAAQRVPRAQQRERAAEALAQVGLRADDLHKVPHEFSGGQRQRIAIARALITRPRLIVADEPVSALDVSVQAQVLNLLRDLQETLGLSYLFISHDLAVVQHVCDAVVVLHQGRIVERGTPADLFHRPQHPYTQALVAAVPRLAPGSARARRDALAAQARAAASR